MFSINCSMQCGNYRLPSYSLPILCHSHSFERKRMYSPASTSIVVIKNSGTKLEIDEGLN